MHQFTVAFSRSMKFSPLDALDPIDRIGLVGLLPLAQDGY